MCVFTCIIAYSSWNNNEQNNIRLKQAQEKMKLSRDAVNIRCMRLLPALCGILFYSKYLLNK